MEEFSTEPRQYYTDYDYSHVHRSTVQWCVFCGRKLTGSEPIGRKQLMVMVKSSLIIKSTDRKGMHDLIQSLFSLCPIQGKVKPVLFGELLAFAN
ncbi:hypothetical protein J6590_094970 [Homalodisca vitripennis]|nr:hypothetical protein J6590_094970 [Homalodisca vitripennis]